MGCRGPWRGEGPREAAARLYWFRKGLLMTSWTTAGNAWSARHRRGVRHRSGAVAARVVQRPEREARRASHGVVRRGRETAVDAGFVIRGATVVDGTGAPGRRADVEVRDGRLSYAPVDDTTLEQTRQAVTGWNGDPPGFDWDWRSVGEYLDRLDRDGIAVNACYLVPQGSVRMLALGWEQRPATEAELATMERLVAEAMAEGAV